MKLKDGVYNALKWIGLTVLPAIAVYCGTVLPLPIFSLNAETIRSIIVIINATGILIGALIGVSQVTIAREQAQEEYYEKDDEDLEVDLGGDEETEPTGSEEA